MSNVVIGAISEHFQKVQFSLSPCIGLDNEPLGAVNDVLCHSDLESVLDYVVVEPPSVKLLLPLDLGSDTSLHFLDLLELWVFGRYFLDFFAFVADRKEQLLFVCVDI